MSPLSRFRRSVVLVSLVLALAPTSARASVSSDEQAFVGKINYSRDIRGYRKLAVRADLTVVARRHSQRMAAREAIYHNRDLATQVTADWKQLGENVGRGPTVYKIHKAFMESSSHRANILYSRWDSVGVGVAYAGGRIYVTEVFADF